MRVRQALVLLPAAIAFGLLLVRLARDVHGKPLVEDEAVAGLIGARPLGELLGTVLWDRGGAPLHFLLVHAVLAFDSSADALRWLSVAFAIGAVLTCFELGRRLGGPIAASAASIAGATSGLLTIYGGIARMYALFAFAGGLAALLFIRALERRTGEAAFTAALAAWLLPAIHPYGGIAVAVEASIALVLWRGRPSRADARAKPELPEAAPPSRRLGPALPALAVAAATIPFAVFDFRLGGRIDVSAGGQAAASPDRAWEQLELAVRGSAGGAGLALALFLVLAGTGLVVLARDRPAVAALAILWLLAPPLLVLAVRSGAEPGLSPRHLIYALPLWVAAAGVGAARLLTRAPLPAQAAALSLLALAAAFAPPGIRDPRSITYAAPVSHRGDLAPAAQRLRAGVGPGDVLFPFSAVYLAALPETGRATALPPGEPMLIARAVRRVELPAGSLFVAVPVGAGGVRVAQLGARLGPRFAVGLHGSWLIVERRGPLDEHASILAAASRALRETRAASSGPLSDWLAAYYDHEVAVLDAAVRRLDSSRGR